MCENKDDDDVQRDSLLQFVIKGRHKYTVYDKHINNLMKNYTIH